MKLSKIICKIFGHKISQIELVIFQLKNSPTNVAAYGYAPITCPRCGETFDPSPEIPAMDCRLPDPPLPRWMNDSSPSVDPNYKRFM